VPETQTLLYERGNPMDIRTQGSINDGAIDEDKYAAARRKRQEYTDAVIFSPSKKKIVVGGP
jgi:hypothetical protein